MFGLDIGKMLSGEGGGNNMITNMIMGQLASPGTAKMLNAKGLEMFGFLASSKGIDKKDVSLLVKVENVPVKDQNGNETTEEKLYLYVLNQSKAIEKIAIDEFIAMMARQAQGG